MRSVDRMQTSRKLDVWQIKWPLYFNLLAPELFFLILAHSVYKMWILQEPNTIELRNKLHFEEKNNGEYIPCLTFWHRNYFLILAHPVCKTWIIQEPNKLELWNKLHFEEKNNGEYIPCLTFWHRNYFLILAHPVYKMWIIREPSKLELWTKLHFEEKKTESIYRV